MIKRPIFEEMRDVAKDVANPCIQRFVATGTLVKEIRNVGNFGCKKNVCGKPEHAWR